MNVGSLFSGVGGFDLGLERAGHRIVFQCEKDAWCRGILTQHWPGVPCYEDVRDVGHRPQRGRDRLHQRRRPRADAPRPETPDVDLLCGGFPCQDLSVAGRRAGLAGERSGLFFEFARVADELVRPGGWILIENVPGLLSSASGRDFAVLLRTLGDIGFHDLAWRVLDSRYFGVPQRRRRVYVLGRRAAGDRARAVLLEPESGGGDFAPGAEARTRVAASLASGSHGAGVSPPGRRQHDDENIVSALTRKGGGPDDNDAQAGHLVGVRTSPPALVKRYAKGTDSDATDAVIVHTLRAEGFDASEDGTGRGTPLTIAGPLEGDGVLGEQPRRGGGEPDRDVGEDGRREGGAELSSGADRLNGSAADPHGVRAPAELPGRVDDSPVDPKPDGPRYAAMGNAVTVNVAHWIGLRLAAQGHPAA